MASNHNRFTTNQGVPVGDNQNSRTAGRRGPKRIHQGGIPAGSRQRDTAVCPFLHRDPPLRLP